MNNKYNIDETVYVVFENRVQRGQIKQISQRWDKLIEYLVDFNKSYHTYLEHHVYKTFDEALATLDKKKKKFQYIGRWYKRVDTQDNSNDGNFYLMLSYGDDICTYAVYDNEYNFLYTSDMTTAVEEVD